MSSCKTVSHLLLPSSGRLQTSLGDPEWFLHLSLIPGEGLEARMEGKEGKSGGGVVKDGRSGGLVG